MKITKAYSTIFAKTLLVIARIPPIDILTEERTQIENKETRDKQCSFLLNKWQEVWESDDGRDNWTRRY